MTAIPGLPKRVRVGDFEFDSERRQLVRGGRAVALSSKEFEFLSLLVSNRPRAVSKDEIQEALWPRTIVAETSLTTLVNDIRVKLGQEGREGPIRTVHGFGYALENDAVTPLQGPAPRLVRGTLEIRIDSPELVLGREPGLPGTIDDASVSRRHARLCRDATGVSLSDLGSKNGTFVNGARLSEPVVLEDGDEVRLGLVTFVYRAPSAPGESSTRTVA
jgi:DNA-binding winged helix-turn-helix (wHTH) protein